MPITPQCKRLRGLLKDRGIKTVGGVRTQITRVRDKSAPSGAYSEYGAAQTIARNLTPEQVEGLRSLGLNVYLPSRQHCLYVISTKG